MAKWLRMARKTDLPAKNLGESLEAVLGSRFFPLFPMHWWLIVIDSDG